MNKWKSIMGLKRGGRRNLALFTGVSGNYSIEDNTCIYIYFLDKHIKLIVTMLVNKHNGGLHWLRKTAELSQIFLGGVGRFF